MVLADTLLRAPAFGVGVGGKEVIAEMRGISDEVSTVVIGNNSLAALGIYLGLVGAGLFIYLLLKHMRHTGVRRIGLISLILLLFSQLMGGIDTFRYWGFIALMWGALAVSDAANERASGAAGGAAP